MLKRRNVFLAGVVVFLMMTTLSIAASPTTTYTEDKPAILLTPHQGTFTIQLKSNPTTGYSWFLRTYDRNIIQPIKQHYQAPTKNSKLIGAPGYEVWTFRVKPEAFMVPQQTMIRFVYTRPWDAMDQSKQVIFRVSTKP